MGSQRLIVASFSVLQAAGCAPNEASVVDDAAYAWARLDGTSDGISVEIGVYFDDYDNGYYPPLGCERFADDTWVSLGGQRLDIVSLGGATESGGCAGVSAIGVLAPQVLVSNPAVEIGDGSGSRTAPLSTTFEPRTARVVSPSDGILRVGVPLAIEWLPDPYGFTFDIGLANVPGFSAEVTSVNGGEIAARLVGESPLPPEPDPYPEPEPEPPMLGIWAEAQHGPLDVGFLTRWSERWSIALPVTVELEPPPPAR
jgi:hypothetical protein